MDQNIQKPSARFGLKAEQLCNDLSNVHRWGEEIRATSGVFGRKAWYRGAGKDEKVSVKM